MFRLALAAILLTGCPPAELPPVKCENTTCHFDGYSQRAVRGTLHTSFGYKGGECRCDCTGISVDLICDVKPTSTGTVCD